MTAWTGLFVPARTPDAAINRLTEAVLRAAEMPEIKARLAQLGFEPTSIPGDQFRRDLSGELKMWADVVEKAKIKLP